MITFNKLQNNEAGIEQQLNTAHLPFLAPGRKPAEEKKSSELTGGVWCFMGLYGANGANGAAAQGTPCLEKGIGEKN